MTTTPSFAGMSALERAATANLGIIIAMSVSQPVPPTEHLLQQAKKVYSCASSELGRWRVAMDKEYILKVVSWRFSKNFPELRTAILSDLDSGYESLQFVMQVAPRFMPDVICSALRRVSRDYLWSKTIIENILRVWPLAADSADDRKLFREVLMQLYGYIAKALVTWLSKCRSSVPEESPFLHELCKVTDLLLKSVQCIAHHGALRISSRQMSTTGLFSGRVVITELPELSPENLTTNRTVPVFTGETQRSWEATFVDQIRSLRHDIKTRKNYSRPARRFAFVMPQEAKLLRPDLISSLRFFSASMGRKHTEKRLPTLPYVGKLRKIMHPN